MIVGIGNDLCDIRRLQQVLERHGPRFVARCFTEVERRKSERRANPAASYAKRFAAKEACAKALVPEGFEPVIHLSLTDEHPYAQAFVVIEAVVPGVGRQ